MLDLTPRFLAQRHETGSPLYCKTDTHWSGRAIDLAARPSRSTFGTGRG